jgi:hypothetical protein
MSHVALPIPHIPQCRIPKLAAAKCAWTCGGVRRRQRPLWKKCDCLERIIREGSWAHRLFRPHERIVSFNFLQLAGGKVIANPKMECEAQMLSLGGLQADSRGS